MPGPQITAQLVDVNGNGWTPGAGYPPTATPVSGLANVANASAVATLAAAAGKTTYISGLEITGAGATAAAVVAATVANLAGGSLQYSVAAPAGVTTPLQPVIVQFVPPIPANAVNTAITVTVPALGSGNTACIVCAHGYQL